MSECAPGIAILATGCLSEITKILVVIILVAALAGALGAAGGNWVCNHVSVTTSVH